MRTSAGGGSWLNVASLLEFMCWVVAEESNQTIMVVSLLSSISVPGKGYQVDIVYKIQIALRSYVRNRINSADVMTFDKRVIWYKIHRRRTPPR
jgi:hypothetical protein